MQDIFRWHYINNKALSENKYFSIIIIIYYYSCYIYMHVEYAG